MCELPTDLEERFENLRSKLDECEIKTREIFERCQLHNPGSTNHESSSIIPNLSEGEEHAERNTPTSISRVLMIHDEHLSRILSGLKTEEIRSKSCSLGWTALCAGGVIQAITQILHCTEERDAIAYLLSWESWRRHRIGSDASGRAPSAGALRSSIATFLSELGVDSRGEYYLKYWRRPLSAARIFRWTLGPVYRVPPTRIAAAGGRTWVRLEPRIGASVCETLRHVRAAPSTALDGQATLGAGTLALACGGGGPFSGGTPPAVESRFFTARRPQSGLGAVGTASSWLGNCLGPGCGGGSGADRIGLERAGAAAARIAALVPVAAPDNLNHGSMPPSESESPTSSESQEEWAGTSAAADGDDWLSAFAEPGGRAAHKRLRIG